MIVLRNISIQRDLGVQIHSSLKVATQVDKVVKKAAFIGRGIEYRNWKIKLQLCKTLVRLHLEYCV